MKQDDSLRNELRNLASLQTEQIKVLNDIKTGDQVRETMRKAESQRASAGFDKTSMYRSASNTTAHSPVAGNLYNPFHDPSGAAMNVASLYDGHGFVNNAQSLVGKNNQYGFYGTIDPGTTVSSMGRVLTNMDYSSRVSKATITGLGAAGTFGIGTAAASMFSGSSALGAGLIGGAVGGLAIGAVTGMASEEIEKNTALKKYIYKNSSRFINPKESNNSRDIAGFSRDETNEAADFVRKMNDEFYMKDEETMQLLQKFTDGGMLKSSTDLKSFKEKMNSLTKTVKEGALILNESYDSIADLLAEMRKAGIDEKDYKDLLGSSNIIGSLNGSGGSETIREILDFVKALNAGTPNNGGLTTSRVETTSLYMSDYYNKLEADTNRNHDEEANYNMIKNLGGSNKAGMHVQAELEKVADGKNMHMIGNYVFDWEADKSSWKFNEKKYDELLKSDMSLEQIAEKISSKFQSLEAQGQGEAVLDWQREQGTYLRNNLEDGQLTDLVYKAVDIYKNDQAMKGHNMTGETVLDQFFGVRDVGTQKLMMGFMQHQTQNPTLKHQMDVQNLWQQNVAEVDAKTPSLSEYISAGFEKGKDFITGGFVKMDNAIGEGIQSFTDWITGRNKRIGPKPEYEETFTLKSSMESSSSDDVRRAIEKTNETIALTQTSLEKIAESGFSVDKNILDAVDNKVKGLDKVVEYKRDIITDWSKVDGTIKDAKNGIQDLAEKNDLSETIVASLHKYNQSKPNDQKIDINETTKKLGEQTFNFGGNTGLATAATILGQGRVDQQLLNLNIDMTKLRGAGAQEAVQGLTLGQLGFDEKLINQVNELIGQTIGGIENKGSATSATENVGKSSKDMSVDDITNMDLRSKSGVSADELNKIIDKKVKAQENATGKKSHLRGMGESLLKAENQTGVNAMYILAHAGVESGWGTSQILENKNNWFGIGAYDRSPMQSAYTFEDKEAGIIAGADWISKNYINSDKNKQYTLKKMNYSDTGAHDYATDRQWSGKIGKVMQELYEDAPGAPGGTIVQQREKVETKGQEYSKVGTTELDVKKYADGLSAGEILSSGANLLDGSDKNIQQVNKDIMSGKKLGESGTTSMEALNTMFTNEIQKINNVIQGNTDSDFYKQWQKMTVGEKDDSYRFVTSLLSNKEFENYRNEIGVGLTDKFKIDQNREKLISSSDIEQMKKIDEDGVYRGHAYNDITEDEALNRMEKYRKGGNKTQGVGETEKKYNLANEGFIESSNRATSLRNFLDDVNGPNGDGSSPSTSQIKQQAVAGVKETENGDLSKFMDSFNAALRSGEYSNAKDVLNRNQELNERYSKLSKKYSESSEKTSIMNNAINDMYLIKDKEGRSAEENKYSNMKAFGENVIGINIDDYNGDTKKYNAAMSRGMNSFYDSNFAAYSDFLAGKNTDAAKRWKSLSAEEKSQTYDSLKILEDTLGFNEEGSTQETIKKNENGKIDKSSIFTDDEKEKMKYIHKSGSKYYYDSSKVNEDSTVEDFDAWQKQGGKRIKSGDTLNKLMEAEKKLNIGDNDDLKTMSSGELSSRVKDSIEKLSAEMMQVTLDVEKETKKLSSRESIQGTIDGNGLFKLNKSEQSAANSSDKKVVDALSESLKKELDQIGQMVNEGDVTGLKKLFASMEKSGRKIDNDQFAKLLELAEKIGAADTTDLMKLLEEIENINNIASDAGKTGILLRNASLNENGEQTSSTMKMDTALKEELLAAFNGADNTSSDAAEIIKAIQGNEADMKQIMEMVMNPEKTNLTQEELEKIAQAVASANQTLVDDILKGSSENLKKFMDSDVWKLSGVNKKELTVEQKTDEKGNLKKQVDSVTMTGEEAGKKLIALEEQIEKNKGKNDKLVAELEGEKDKLTTALSGTYLEAIQAMGKSNEEATKKLDDSAGTADKFASRFSEYDAAMGSAITTMDRRIAAMEGKVVNYGNGGGQAGSSLITPGGV